MNSDIVCFFRTMESFIAKLKLNDQVIGHKITKHKKFTVFQYNADRDHTSSI